MKIIEWLRKNALLALVLLVGGYFIINLAESFFGTRTLSLNTQSVSKSAYSEDIALAPSGAFDTLSEASVPFIGSRGQNYTPQPDVEERLVIQESNLSLLVKNVTDIKNKIIEYAQGNGGYMVSSNVSNPQDAPTATVVIRVGSDKLDEALNYFHSLSVKVVSENLVGRDVTDQYVDIDTRIAQLERTKARFEALLEQAEEISDITNLTQQILSYQNQIDSYKGRQDALEKNAQLAKLTIYLSTDEIALPYAPSETFRPNVIFKLAVRSLVKTLRGLATIAIWVGVYAAIWVPALAIFIFIKKWLKRRKLQLKQGGSS